MATEFEFENHTDEISPFGSPVGSPKFSYMPDGKVTLTGGDLQVEGTVKSGGLVMEPANRNPEQLHSDNTIWMDAKEPKTLRVGETPIIRGPTQPPAKRSIVVWDDDLGCVVGSSGIWIDKDNNIGNINKISMDGLVDPPTGIAFNPQASNPSGTQSYNVDTLWKSSASGNLMLGGAGTVAALPLTVSPAVTTNLQMPYFSGTNGGVLASSAISIAGTSFNQLTGVNSLTFTSSTNAISAVNTTGSFSSSATTVVSETGISAYVTAYNQTYFNLTAEPTGFSSAARTASTIAVNDGTREFSITGTFDYWIKGIKYSVASDVAALTMGNTEGLHYIYLTTGKALGEQSSFTATILQDYAYVAIVYWSTTETKAILISDQRHEFMPWQTHYNLYLSTGALYSAGLALDGFTIGDGTATAHAQLGYSSGGQIMDEDIFHTIPAVAAPANFWVYYKDATGWRTTGTISAAPVVKGTNRINYNPSGSSLGEVSADGYYALAHIIATSDNASTKRMIAIMGQNEYTTLGAAQTGAVTEIETLVVSGLPMSEYVIVASIIYQSNSTWTSNTYRARVVTTTSGANYESWLKKTFNPSTASDSHSGLSGLGNDDHPQYVRAMTSASVDNTIPLWNGTTGRFIDGSAVVIGGTAFSEMSGLASFKFGTGAEQAITSISTATTMGGTSAANDVLSSQLATKTYIDGKLGGTVEPGIDQYIARYEGTDAIVDSGVFTSGTSDNIANAFAFYASASTEAGLKCDIIAETTTNAGVTIDSNVMKDYTVQTEKVVLPTISLPTAFTSTTVWAPATGVARINSNNVVQTATTSSITANTVMKATGTNPYLISASSITIDGSNNISGAADISCSTATVTGKLTVGGLIDPTGIALTHVAANPGSTVANSVTVWCDSTTSDILRGGANPIVTAPTTGIVDNTLMKWSGTTGGLVDVTGVTIADTTNNISGAGQITAVNFIATSTTLGMETDIIKEHTSAAGVTIESTLFKDGGVQFTNVADPTLSGNYLWSSTAGVLQNGTSAVLQISTSAVTQNAVPKFSTTAPSVLTASGVTIDGSNNMTIPGAAITDTVSERTATNGVAVDGLLIKDFALGFTATSADPLGALAKSMASEGTLGILRTLG